MLLLIFISICSWHLSSHIRKCKTDLFCVLLCNMRLHMEILLQIYLHAIQICSFISLSLTKISKMYLFVLLCFIYFLLYTFYVQCIAHRTCSSIDACACANSLMISEKLSKLERKKTTTTKNVLAEYQENYLFPSSMALVFFC